MALVQIDPNVAFDCSSQPPSSRCCDDRLNPPSTPRSPSATDVASPACAHRPDRSPIVTIMRCARASSRRWNANFSTGVASGLMPRHAWPSSSSSRDGTIHAGATRPSAICHPSTTKGVSYPPLAQIHNCPRNRGNSSDPCCVVTGTVCAGPCLSAAFPAKAGLSVLAWLTLASELDRGQAERDPDPGIFGQASMMLRRGRTIVPDLASRKPIGVTFQSSTAQAPRKQSRWLPYGCQK